MPPKKLSDACMRCEQEYPVQETRFSLVEEAEGQDFMCRMCVLESRLDRLEEEKQQLKIHVDKLVEELKTEK